MIKLLALGFTLFSGMLFMGYRSLETDSSGKSDELLDLFTYNGNIGQRDVQADIRFYGSEQCENSCQKVEGTLTFDDSDQEIKFTGNYNPQTGDIIMDAEDGTRFTGKYFEDYCYIEGSVKSGSKLLAFNWEL